MASTCGKWQSESRWFCRSPQFLLYHACEHSARESRADSCTHCLHARIYRCGGREFSPCADEIRTFCQPSPVGEGGSRRLTDEVSFLDKATFPLSYFSVKKSTKSQQGGLAPSSFRTTGGVHELVARAMRGKYVRHRLMVQIGSFALPATSYYHAC